MFGHDDQHDNQEHQDHENSQGDQQQHDHALQNPGVVTQDDTSAMGGYVADDGQKVTPVSGATDDLLDI